MTTPISITREAGPAGGRYVARVAGREGEAELVFQLRDDNVIVAEHTEAPATMRGTGAALALVEHMLAEARAGGLQIIAHCPYVRAQLAKHPDWADVMREGE